MTSKENLPRPNLRLRRRYWLRVLRILIIALVAAILIPPFALGFSTVWGLTHPACLVGSDPGWFNPNFEDISFTSTNDLQQQGYFIPGTNTATIIIAPAYAGNRGAELDVAQIYNAAGFNVFTLNSRACTDHKWISLGYQEVEDIQSAYRYLQTRSDFDPTRVGLQGFSSAGATVMMSAEQMPEVRSVVAMGGYHDYPTALGLGNVDNFFVQIYQFGAVVAYRLVTGDDVHSLSPIDMMDKLPPRPLLLIYGTREVSLPGAQAMLEKAKSLGMQADLWIVDGADHGQYLLVAHDEFVRRVVEFQQSALLSDQPQS